MTVIASTPNQTVTFDLEKPKVLRRKDVAELALRFQTADGKSTIDISLDSDQVRHVLAAIEAWLPGEGKRLWAAGCIAQSPS